MDTMWQEYGIEELEKGMQKLFPTFRISVTDLMTQILQGDILGAVGCLLKEVIREMSNSATGIRNILIWLIVLGILSALLIHFVEVFDKHQIADLSFYFIYLLMGVILLQCFSGVLETARETVENIVLFVRLMVPTFLLTVGVASGPVTVGAGYQLMLLLIYGTEKILLGVVLPLIYSSADDDQRNLGRGKTGTFGGFTGKADQMDTEGFPGCGHRNQSVPVADHTGGGFLEKFRSGEGCLGTAGDRKCCGWGSGAGAWIGSCDPE